MCCGQNRARARQAHSVTSPRPHFKPAMSEQRVRFLGLGSLVVKGAHSGRLYSFSSDHPDLNVDTMDAEVLMKTGLFRFR
jgi:hypothetical protein